MLSTSATWPWLNTLNFAEHSNPAEHLNYNEHLDSNEHYTPYPLNVLTLCVSVLLCSASL